MELWPPPTTAGTRGEGEGLRCAGVGAWEPAQVTALLSVWFRKDTFAVLCPVSARGTLQRPHLVPLRSLAWPRRRDVGHALVMGMLRIIGSVAWRALELWEWENRATVTLLTEPARRDA